MQLFLWNSLNDQWLDSYGESASVSVDKRQENDWCFFRLLRHKWHMELSHMAKQPDHGDLSHAKKAIKYKVFKWFLLSSPVNGQVSVDVAVELWLKEHQRSCTVFINCSADWYGEMCVHCECGRLLATILYRVFAYRRKDSCVLLPDIRYFMFWNKKKMQILHRFLLVQNARSI